MKLTGMTRTKRTLLSIGLAIASLGLFVPSATAGRSTVRMSSGSPQCYFQVFTDYYPNKYAYGQYGAVTVRGSWWGCKLVPFQAYFGPAAQLTWTDVNAGVSLQSWRREPRQNESFANLTWTFPCPAGRDIHVTLTLYSISNVRIGQVPLYAWCGYSW